MNPRLFQEAIRSAKATYAGPFMFAVSLLFSVICLGGFMLTDAAGRWLFGSLAVLSAVCGFGIGLYGTLFKPELLRSEEHSFRMTVASLVGDPDVDREMKTELVRHLGPAPIRRPRLREEGNRDE
jgi:hypothetical protein